MCMFCLIVVKQNIAKRTAGACGTIGCTLILTFRLTVDSRCIDENFDFLSMHVMFEIAESTKMAN